MDFQKKLEEERRKLGDAQKQTSSEKKKKSVHTPKLHKNYWDDIDRYRKSAYMTNIADMNVYHK